MTGPRVFIWLGHPTQTSLCKAIADTYEKAASDAGAEVRRLDLAQMTFDPDMKVGYTGRMKLEPDLVTWQENLTWCNHTAWIYPYWWGGMPAKMKGVLDRALLPGFGFSYKEKGPWWNKLLTGRSADVIMTADTPVWYDRWLYGRPGRNQVKHLVLEFTGIKPVRHFHFGPVKDAKPEKIESWLEKAKDIGTRAAR